MKHSLFIIFISLFSYTLSAQQPGTDELMKTAKAFMQSGDWDNAIIVLNRALQQDKENIDLQKDLIQCYYYKRDYVKAVGGVEGIIDRNDADVMTFQIAGNVYKALEDVKEAEKTYKKGLKKFPQSGPLYSEYGELLWARKDVDAIKLWEKGIQTDPGYAGNYYNAALFYYYTKDKAWTLIYGEVFVNMESLTKRAIAMKELLLKAYKEKLFADADIFKDQQTDKNEFAKAFLECMNKQSSLVSLGITTESLTMIRTRFILDWFQNYADKFPFRLFDYQQQLLKEGMFNSYNQWLFGVVENLPAYTNWTKTNSDQYNSFDKFQKARIFKIPSGQYYQNSK